MTQQQYEESTRMILNEYFTPVFQVAGGIAAVAVLVFVVILVIAPFVRRV